MKKAKLLAAALAAACAFTFAPVFDTGIAVVDTARPAFARASAAAEYNASLHALPLTTRTYYNSDWDGDFEMFRSHWTDISFYGNAKAPDRNIAKALADYSRARSNVFGDTRKSLLSQAKADWRERKAKGMSAAPFYGPYWFAGEVRVHRADSAAVSFLEDSTLHEGGFHSRSVIIGRNFDGRTGKELQLSDVFVNKYALAEALITEMKADGIQERFMENDAKALEENVDRMTKDGLLIWTLEPGGVSFYFSPYMLGGTYADDAYFTTLFFTEYPDIFKKDAGGNFAWRGPQGYCLDLQPYTAVRLSAGPRKETLKVALENNRIVIEHNGKEYRNDLKAAEIYPTFVRCADGRKYLYVDYEEPAGKYSAETYRLYVYDLNGASPAFTGAYPMTRLASSRKDTAMRQWYVMSDPNWFYVTPVLDNEFVPAKWLRCRVGKDGRPEVMDAEGAKG